jgi:hypothetical protein
LNFDLDLRPVSNQRQVLIQPNVNSRIEFHGKVMDVASSNRSQVFLFGKHGPKRRNELEIICVELVATSIFAVIRALRRSCSADRTASASELACDEVKFIVHGLLVSHPPSDSSTWRHPDEIGRRSNLH